MNGEFIAVSRVVTVPANNNITVDFDSPYPYKNLCIWVMGQANNIVVQPLMAGASDGSSTSWTGTAKTVKVFQQTAGELRPQTTGLKKHQESDPSSPQVIKSAVKLTSTNGSAQNLTIYMCAESAS